MSLIEADDLMEYMKSLYFDRYINESHLIQDGRECDFERLLTDFKALQSKIRELNVAPRLRLFFEVGYTDGMRELVVEIPIPNEIKSGMTFKLEGIL